MTDHEGNPIFYCPHCQREYTIPVRLEQVTLNYHCEGENCRYERLLPLEPEEQKQETPSIDSSSIAISKGGVC